MKQHTSTRLVMLAALVFCSLGRASADGLALGSSAPPFSLPDIQGHSIQVSSSGSCYYILNFWAFWCDTWKKEFPSLQELSSDQQTDRFRLIAISVDGTRLPLFQHDTKGMHIPFPVLLDPGSRVAAQYQIRHVPTVMIIDPQGQVRYTAVAYPGNHVLLSELRRIESSSAQTSTSTY